MNIRLKKAFRVIAYLLLTYSVFGGFNFQFYLAKESFKTENLNGIIFSIIGFLISIIIPIGVLLFIKDEKEFEFNSEGTRKTPLLAKIILGFFILALSGIILLTLLMQGG